ncbi:MAG: GH3 auxin-responsive promoter family protein [Candidatus Bathyarchaeota archaeon]|nr:GH3 auxin-responsive promoter family protein [Candidatus Bathyarchaeota archaeon]
MLKQVLFPFAKKYALNFLTEKNYLKKQERLFNEKIAKQKNTNIGKKMRLDTLSNNASIPCTKYEFYRSFYENPKEGDFLYHLSDYVKAITSGTLGKPKTFMLPKTGLKDNLQKTGFSVMLIGSHDQDKVTFEVGDTVYRNTPGGSHISAFLTDLFDDNNSGWVKQVPDVDLPFDTKVDYFVKNHKDIDIAYMTITTLLDDIVPRIDDQIQLKGFMSQDRSAEILKEDIKKLTGSYPKTTYGSTETMYCSIPSIQYPGAFLFDWRVIYSEFIPENELLGMDGETSTPETEVISIGEVEKGEKYQLIATPYKSDMTRYVMPDIMECIAYRDDILETEFPVFRYYARGDNLIVLHNFTRIAEEEIIEVLISEKIPYVDFTAKRELEGSRDYLHIYLELREPMSVEEVTNKLHTKLIEYDKDWRDLCNFLGYTPLKVTLLPSGAFKRYLAKQKGMPKIIRINMKEETLNSLTSSD